MGSGKWIDKRVGKRVKDKREDRGWTQAEMAKKLSDNGIHPMHPTTIAKIELGQRSVRINEAVGIAELFEVSVDSLLGYTPGSQHEHLTYELLIARDRVRQSYEVVLATMETIRRHIEELPAALEGVDMVQKQAQDIWSNRVLPARAALSELVKLIEDLVGRQQGTRGLSQEALKGTASAANPSRAGHLKN